MSGRGADRTAWPALMARAQAGDRQAYGRLLRAMMPVVRALVRKRIADDVLAEDVVQDVLLAIHRVRHTYDPARPILPWVGAIVSARTIDALRRRGRHHRREVWDDAVSSAMADPQALARMERFAVNSELDRLLGLLPARQRAAVELVRLREMSLADAGDAISLSVPAIKALLHRAFLRMRQHEIGDHG